jgi:Protein of unknown function (DUF3761)
MRRFLLLLVLAASLLGATAAPSHAATPLCKQSYSFSEHASGTCSHHGGVAVWIHHP